MSVAISPMQHSWMLAEDFASLDHWHEYGTTDRAYDVVSDVPVEGNALRIGTTGALRIARHTDIIPGEPVVVSLWAYSTEHGAGPCSVQLRNLEGLSGFFNIMAAGNQAFVQGWNRVIVHTAAPSDWVGVRIALFTTSGVGGYIARMRAMPEEQEVD